jgi:hypothetical protein
MHRHQHRQRADVLLLVGGEVLVRTSEIVAILDQPALTAAPTREFVGFARGRGLVEDLTAGAPVKSAVVCRARVFLSPFSSATLRRRLLPRSPA